uniref:LIM domain protein n=1 Tax=Haemonchus contortus TaxID=6289 RepID=A0A7I4XYU7_HAECO|nr:Zinc finger domain containing protein [Haemonchus contortus]
MAEFNATAFLTQLDAFGRPPPPQKLNDGRGNVAKELATKLNMINLDKQRRIRGEMLAPSEQGMVQLGNGLKNAKVVRKQICDADVQKWRNDVLSVNRPRVNGLNQHETAESAREYARKIADTIPKTNGFHALSGSDEDVGNRSDSATDSLPSPSSELIVTTNHERKYSDYSSASSQKSPTPPSQSSFSDYRSQASPPDSQRSDSPLKTDGLATRVNVSSVQADRFSRRSPPERQLMASPKQRADLSLAEILSRKQQPNGSSPNYAVGLTQQVRLTDKTMPAGKPPVFKPAADEQKRQVRWREISDALEAQDQKFEKLSERLRRDLVVEQKHQVGFCANCRLPMYDNEERYTVNDSTYHRACFTCEVCGRELREQQFYLSDGRFYCKQDYLYNMERKVTRCAECKQPIQEMVLSALGRNYHPACFTCTACGMCLDGIQFALDKNNQVYCLPDYYDRFAPRCHRCKNAILPDENTGETVRIVALDNNYHLDCYSCEGCGLKLTDEGDACCYPLDKHLLCEKCHLAWRRSGSEAPISDL